MKKLISMIALVAMVAMSSVAYAATVTVNGNILSSATLNDCSATLTDISVAGVSGTCVPTYDVNSANGYTIDYAISDVNLTNTTTFDIITTLAESVVTATTCDGSTPECWSYMVASNDASVAYGTDAGQGAAGTSYNSGQHGFAVETQGVITDGTSGDISGQVLTMTYYATRATTTDAGAYSNTGSTLTLTAI